MCSPPPLILPKTPPKTPPGGTGATRRVRGLQSGEVAAWAPLRKAPLYSRRDQQAASADAPAPHGAGGTPVSPPPHRWRNPCVAAPHSAEETPACLG